jgi:hypothetical protein
LFQDLGFSVEGWGIGAVWSACWGLTINRTQIKSLLKATQQQETTKAYKMTTKQQQ